MVASKPENANSSGSALLYSIVLLVTQGIFDYNEPETDQPDEVQHASRTNTAPWRNHR